MKKYFFIILFLTQIFTFASAQVQTELRNFNLEFGNITYRQSYPMPNLTAAEVSEKLLKYIPTINGLGEVKFNGKVFYGNVQNMMIDYPKYGGKWLTILPLLNSPMRSIITIEPKDGKYDVVLSQMEFRTDFRTPYSKVNNHFTEGNGAIFSPVKRVTDAMAFMDLFFTDILQVSDKRVVKN